MEDEQRLQAKVYGVCLITAPALMAAATFFWQEGRIGLIGGALQMYAMVFWIPAFLGLFQCLRPHWPRLAVLGPLVGMYASVAGSGFGMEGIYEAAFRRAGASEVVVAAVPGAMGLALPLTLRLPGLLFPLTLLFLGVAFYQTKVTPVWVALLLALGAVGFPASRLPRIELIAHIADVLLLIPLAWIGWRYLTRSSATAIAPRPSAAHS